MAMVHYVTLAVWKSVDLWVVVVWHTLRFVNAAALHSMPCDRYSSQAFEQHSRPVMPYQLQCVSVKWKTITVINILQYST